MPSAWPSSVAPTWIAAERVNAIVDISDSMETKLSALRAHVSQHGETDDLDGRVRGRARDEGAPLGIEAGESYAVIDLR